MAETTIQSGSAGRRLRALAARPGYPGFALTLALSQTAQFMFAVAGVVLVLDRTGSPALAGATAAAAVLPGALTGPLLGAWLDVTSHRRSLIVADKLLSAAALIALVGLAGQAPNWTLPAVAVAYSITSPLSTGSFAGALPELAGAELLSLATAVQATSINVAVVLGPALAGVLAGIVPIGRVVELQAAITVLTALLVAINPAFDLRAAQRSRSTRHALSAGLSALGRERLLRTGLVTNSLGAFGWGLMMVGFPVYAVHSLNSGHNAAGYLWAALAVGSIAGTALFARGIDPRRMAVSYVGYAASALLWLLADSLGLAIGLVLLTGVLEGPGFTGAIGLPQRLAPAHARSAVLSTWLSVTSGSMALGQLLGGAITGTTGSATIAIVLLAAAGVTGGSLLWIVSHHKPG